MAGEPLPRACCELARSIVGGGNVGDEYFDAIGDLHIAGHPMLAHYTAFKSGHALYNKLLRALLADMRSYEIVRFDNAADAPAGFAELAPAVILLERMTPLL